MIRRPPRSTLDRSSAASDVYKRQMEYMVVIEQGEDGYGAYVPDLPGCVAAADTKDEVLALIQEAIVLHLELMQEDGLPIPVPHSVSEYVAVAL